MAVQKPLIGLVCGNHREYPTANFVNRAYIEAILAAGGTPVLIPFQPKENLRQIVDLLAGIVVPGGVDVDPMRYGESPSPGCGKVDPDWDEQDLNVLGLALERDLPVLAICRGMQVLNVAYGGSLVQDIASEVDQAIKHRQEAPVWHATHTIRLEEGNLLADIWADAPLKVNSFHHQAVKTLGNGLRVAATAPDGIIEAVEAVDRRFVLGVQWHPELMIEHCPGSRSLFTRFVACAAGK